MKIFVERLADAGHWDEALAASKSIIKNNELFQALTYLSNKLKEADLLVKAEELKPQIELLKKTIDEEYVRISAEISNFRF